MVYHNKLKQLLRIKLVLNSYYVVIIKITVVNLNLTIKNIFKICIAYVITVISFSHGIKDIPIYILYNLFMNQRLIL